MSAAPASGAQDPTGAPGLDKVTLQLKWKHQFQFAGYYAALEKGFYRDAGLDVAIVEPDASTEPWKNVLNGKAEFGVAMSDLVILRAQGQPVVALASIYQHSPLALLVPGDRGIGNLHELAGKKIMLEDHAEELVTYLESEGLPLSKLIVYPHTYDTADLLEGKIDAMSAYSTDEPFMLLEKGMEYSIFSPRSGGIDFYGDTLFTTEKQVEKHPKRVKAFLEASLKGWEYAMDHPEEMVDLILSKYSKRHSRDHLLFEAEKTKRLIMDQVVEIGYMNPGRWRHIADTYSSMNLVPKNFDLDGFLFDRGAGRDLKWVYAIVAGAVVLVLLAFLLTGRFYRLNAALKREIKTRGETEDKLRESRRTFAILMSNLPGMAYRCLNDDKWTMLFASEGCLNLTGYGPGELEQNKALPFLSLIHDQDREKVTIEVNNAVNEKRPFTITYRLGHKSGAFKWVWEQGRGIYDEKGDLLHLEGFITDISDQKKAEGQREELIRQLEKAMDEIKVLQGLLPICSSCKNIRDEKGNWNQLEAYITEHSEVQITHGICPDCAKKLYPGIKVYED